MLQVGVFVSSCAYSSEMLPISFDDAVSRVLSFKNECLIKPSIDSGEGRLIKFFEPRLINTAEIENTFKTMGANFIVQAGVKQHEELAKLNPSSLNTIRVVSFFFENNVYVLSCILRVGAPNSKVDNVGAGGFACPIQTDGQLNTKAVNRRAEWVEENSAGVKFAEIKVPCFDKVIDTVKNAHKRLAHFKLWGSCPHRV